MRKSNFKKMKWISFNPGSNKSSKMSIFASLKVYTCDWKKVECIFLRIDTTNKA